MNFQLSEILLILIVALLVIKPSQLPTVAFKLGRNLRNLRALFTKLKADLNQDSKWDEPSR